MTALSVQICTVKLPTTEAKQGMPKCRTTRAVDDHPGKKISEQLRKGKKYAFLGRWLLSTEHSTPKKKKSLSSSMERLQLKKCF